MTPVTGFVIPSALPFSSTTKQINTTFNSLTPLTSRYFNSQHRSITSISSLDMSNDGLDNSQVRSDVNSCGR